MLLTAATFCAMYARTTFSPLQEAMRTALTLSDNEMALLQGPALALPVMLATLPLGALIDRHSRARLILILAICSVIGNACTALSHNFAMLFFARCVVGLTATTTTIAAFSMLADLYDPSHRGRASTVVVIGQYGGMASAFALGGELITTWGYGPNGWRWAMSWLTAPLVLVSLLLLTMREPTRMEVEVSTPFGRIALYELSRYGKVLAPLLIGLLMAEIAFQAVIAWAMPTLSRSLAIPPVRIGAIMAVGFVVSGILGPMAGGALADLCHRTGGPRRTIALLTAIAILSAPGGLFPLAPNVALASVLLVSFMTFLGALFVSVTALITIVIPNELRGLCLAGSSAANVLFGVGLAPVTVSLLSGALGGPHMVGKALSTLATTACALGAVAFAIGIRFSSRAASCETTKSALPISRLEAIDR
jgi:MFS transporter, Spinster family, sphingosine-1-phosphate transporter